MFPVTKYYFINTFVLFLFDMKQLSSPNHLYVIDVCSLVFRDLCDFYFEITGDLLTGSK